MPDYRAIYSVGTSLVTYLRNAYPSVLRDEFPCDFKLVSSGEINDPESEFGTAITLYLHRITMNGSVRNGAPGRFPEDGGDVLTLDLHYLLTVWASSALAEHTILGWVTRELYRHQALSKSDLTPEPGWADDDVIQVIPNEISTEDMMRIWDALQPAYRVSSSYVARVVRIDPERDLTEHAPVVGRRFELTEHRR